MKDLLKTLENSKTYTLNVAEAMPDKGYTFKPAEGVWNFGELLHHIAYGIQWWEDNYIKGNTVNWNPPVARTGKKEVAAYLNKAYDDLKQTLGHALTPDQVKGFYATLDHITHHRGQAVTYLRAQGATPPEYMY